jgi:hypothetical protein
MLTEIGLLGDHINEADIVAMKAVTSYISAPEVEIYMRGGGRIIVQVGPRREPHTSTCEDYEKALEKAREWIRNFVQKVNSKRKDFPD